MNQQQVIIVINPFCHQGQGWKRWNSIKNEVLKLLPVSTIEIVLEKEMQLEQVLLPLLQTTSSTYIISAGGDGSMHYLVNFLLSYSGIDLNTITLGAIGLGSSNDFLKPFNNKINNIPVRIDISSSVKNHDVGLATYYDEYNQYKEQYFIVNASFGVTATANWNFNNPGKILKFLKSNFTGGAILYTAVTTILQHKNINCKIKFDGTEMSMNVSNINILKIPFVSGSFWYNQIINADDGELGLNICRDMNKIELLKILTRLEKGKFSTTEKTISEKIQSFQLSSANPVIFECDGETELANQVSISVMPGAIKILTY
jgi:diacylglycerol kinase (ATP)